MYNIDQESFKKLVDTYNFLNQVEVKGIANLELLYGGLRNLQDVVKKINEEAQTIIQDQAIEVDNTQGEK